MVKKLLTNKRMLFWAIFVLVIVICLSTLGGTFAWMYSTTRNVSNQTKSAQLGKSVSVDGVIDFELDPNIVGIAGDIVNVTSVNRIFTGNYTDPYIYRVEYSVKNRSAAYIEEMFLTPEIIADLGLVEHGSVKENNYVTAIYYGLNSSIKDLDMGPLQIKFQEATNDNADEDLYINVEVISCQQSRDAFMDAYSISEKDMPKFMSLLGK